MKDMFKSLGRKLKDNKGEVSVEWALIAVIMAVAIVFVFDSAVKDALVSAIGRVTTALTGAGA